MSVLIPLVIRQVAIGRRCKSEICFRKNSKHKRFKRHSSEIQMRYIRDFRGM